MDPIQLKRYLKERKTVPLMDILNHFRVEKGVAEPMLDLWIKKGKVKCHNATSGCQNGCCKCDPSMIEFYEWAE